MVHNNKPWSTATAAAGRGGDGGYQRVLRERLELTLTTTRIIIIITTELKTWIYPANKQ